MKEIISIVDKVGKDRRDKGGKTMEGNAKKEDWKEEGDGSKGREGGKEGGKLSSKNTKKKKRNKQIKKTK